MNVDADVDLLLPLGVVTATGTDPAETAFGALTVSWVAETTERSEPTAVPNETEVAPTRLVPVTVTRVPPARGPVDGLRALTVGAANPVTARTEVLAAAAVVVGTTYSLKYQRPCPGMEYFAVKAPALVVVAVKTVDHDVDDEGRRCTCTVRAA